MSHHVPDGNEVVTGATEEVVATNEVVGLAIVVVAFPDVTEPFDPQADKNSPATAINAIVTPTFVLNSLRLKPAISKLPAEIWQYID